MNYIPRGRIINAKYVKEALAKSLVIFRKKRSIMSFPDWFLHWDNALVHTIAPVQEFLTVRGIKKMCHPPYFLDLMTADFYLSLSFWK